jgi:Ca-activated chloride channel family protein
MVILGAPWWLALLPLPWLVWWWLPSHREAATALSVPELDRLAAATRSTPGPGASVRATTATQLALVILCWLLLVLACARPRWVGDPIVRPIATRDLLLAVDLSGSMESEDLLDAQGAPASRLAVVQDVVGDFLEQRDGDRVGLLVFGNAPFLHAPFTDDLSLCRELLDDVRPRMAGPQTMLGDALGLAISVFERSELEDRVLILLTDGNDTGSRVPPREAARIAGDRGITIHAVAVGDPASVGEQALDELTLRELAEITGGSYAHADDREALLAAYARLDEIEPRTTETVGHRPTRDLAHLPALAVLLLTLAYRLVVALRGQARQRPRDAALLGASGAVAIALGLALSGGTWRLGGLVILRPAWLAGWIPALALTAWQLRAQDERRRWSALVAPHLLSHLLVSPASGKGPRPVHALAALWLAGFAVAAGPSWRLVDSPFSEETAALMVVLETTPTMLAQDVQPSRLERAQHKIADLLERNADRVTGLVAYAGSAHLAVPPTEDVTFVGQMSGELWPPVMPVSGDRPADALALAAASLVTSGLTGSILWVTDGLEADELDALARFRAAGGPPVTLLAVAADADARVPAGSPPAPPLDRDRLAQAADALGSRVTVVSADDSDLTELEGRLASDLASAQAADAGARFQDGGVALVPVLALILLLWFRTGWRVRT